MADPSHARDPLAHLEDLRRQPTFQRAQVQSQALAEMVHASLEGRYLSGHALAEAVYGRSDEPYVRAMRQVVRELRFKLSKHYETKPSPIRFRIAENGYEVEIVEDPPEGERPAAPASTAATAAPPRGRAFWSRPAVYASAAVAVAVVTVVLWFGFHLFSGNGLGRPATIAMEGRRPVALDATGHPLPRWTEVLDGLAAWSKPPEGDRRPEEYFKGVPLARADGRNVLALVACDPDLYRSCRLMIVDARDGRKLGEIGVPLNPDGTTLTRELHERPGQRIEPDFIVPSLVPAELDGDGRRDEILVALSHNGSFPTEILGMDWGPRRGFRVLLDYWVMGNSVAAAIPDADGDGIDEIVALGTFNGNNRSFFELLPRVTPGEVRPARSPESDRPAVIRELEGLPQRGLFLSFPDSVLANPAFPDLYRVRAYAERMDWRPEAAEIRLLAEDRAVNLGDRTGLRVEYTLPVDGRPARAQMASYDAYLAELTKRIADGSVEDRWGIAKTQDLSRFAAELAGKIAMWDENAPGWKPYDPAALAARFGTPETRRRSSPAVALVRF